MLMAEKITILDVWPKIQEDLKEFVKNPHSWVTKEMESIVGKGLNTSIANDRILLQEKFEQLSQIMKMLDDIYNPS